MELLGCLTQEFQKKKSTREGVAVIGDDTGIITIKFREEQLNISNKVGTPLLIRNGIIVMENGHMKLLVDRWGKLTDKLIDADLEGFNFQVRDDVDKSQMEYELIVLNNDDANNHMGNENQSNIHPMQNNNGPFSNHMKMNPMYPRGGRRRGGRGRR